MPRCPGCGEGRLGGNDAHVRIPRLQVAGHAGERAARADTRHEHIYPPVRVLPDFRPGGQFVDAGIGGIVELAGDEGAGNGPMQFIGLGDRSGHSPAAGREDNLRPQGTKEVAPLKAHRLGHRQYQVIAADGSHHRKAHAGVSAGRLDEGRTGTKQAAPFGIVNEGEGRAGLHAPAGIERLDFGHKGTRQATKGAVSAQLHKRSVADKGGEVFRYVHTGSFFH